jgi:hypothetical protein
MSTVARSATAPVRRNELISEVSNAVSGAMTPFMVHNFPERAFNAGPAQFMSGGAPVMQHVLKWKDPTNPQVLSVPEPGFYMVFIKTSVLPATETLPFKVWITDVENPTYTGISPLSRELTATNEATVYHGLYEVNIRIFKPSEVKFEVVLNAAQTIGMVEMTMVQLARWPKRV